MAYESIKVSEKDGISIVSLNRPEKMNSLTLKMIDEIIEYLDSKQDSNIKVIILKGEGKHYCSGADVSAFPGMGPQQGHEFHLRLNDLAMKIRNFQRPVIAMLHGYSMGGGLEIAESADIRVAGESAVIAQPEINIGINAGAGGNVILPRLVGRGMAMYLILTGERISARKAMEIGLVDLVFPDSILEDEVMKLASRIRDMPSQTVIYAKMAVSRGSELPVESALSYEAALFGLLFSDEETKSRLEKFLNRGK
ncbi:MAG: enoyl-CoA hydratase/isomerase family protein [Thermoplasmata archaeon]